MKIFGWLGIHLFLVHRVNAVSCKPLYLWRQVYLRKGHQDNVDLQLTAQLRYICLSLAPFSFVLCTLIGNGCAGRRHRAPQFTAWDLCLLPLVTGVHSSWHFCFMLANRKGWCYSWRVTLFWQLAWFFWLKNVWTHGSLWQPKAVSTHMEYVYMYNGFKATKFILIQTPAFYWLWGLVISCLISPSNTYQLLSYLPILL